MSRIKEKQLKRKKGNAFYLYYRNSLGKEKCVTLPADNKRDAEKLKKQFDKHRFLIKLGIIGEYPDIKLSDFWEKFIRISAPQKQASTIKRDLDSFKPFLEYFGNVNITTITPIKLEEYRVSRLSSVQASTINTAFRHLKAAFTRAEEWGYLKRSPFKRIKLLKVVDPPYPQKMTVEEVQRFLSVIDNIVHKALFYTFLKTGFRRSEALNLTWDNIKFDENEIWVYRKKVGKFQQFPLNRELKKVLYNLPSNGNKVFRISGSWAGRKMKDYLERAGISTHFSMHSLRHTVITEVDKRSSSRYTAQRIAGHSNPATTARYVHEDIDDLYDGLATLPW